MPGTELELNTHLMDKQTYFPVLFLMKANTKLMNFD